MASKRIIRITAFTITNVAIIYLVIFLIVKFEVECGDCYSIEKSETIESAYQNKSIINAYHIFKTNSYDLDTALINIDFWSEKAKMISRDRKKVHPVNILSWSDIPSGGKYKFKVLNTESSLSSGINEDYLYTNKTRLNDTIKIGIYKEEKIINTFTYIKKTANNNR